MARPREKSKVSVPKISAYEEKSTREAIKIRNKVQDQLEVDIQSLYTDGTESDLTILSSGESFAVHKPIIRTRHIKFWRDVLKCPILDTVNLSLRCNGDLKQVLRCIYRKDALNVLDSVVQGLIDEVNAESGNCFGDITPNKVTSASKNHVSSFDHLNGTASSDDFQNNVPQDTSSLDEAVGTSGSSKEVASDDNMNFVGSNCHAKENGAAPSFDLGTDLLKIFDKEETSDLLVKVGDVRFQLHKCILSARSSYFAAMLGGGWMESDSSEISLEGVSAEVMRTVFYYMYGGNLHTGDLPPDVSLPELIFVADMYAVSGLKDVISYIIRRDKCHFFHKPCTECTYGVISILPVAYSYGLIEIYEKAMTWVSRNAVRVWGAKPFQSLPEEILIKCLETIVRMISRANIIDMVTDCDKLMGSFTSVKSSENVIGLTNSLMDECVKFLSNNMVTVFNTQKFCALGQTMALGLSILEDVFAKAIMLVPFEKACQTHTSILALVQSAEKEDCSWNEDFCTLVGRLYEKSKHFMMLHINQLVDTHGWGTYLTQELQDQIKKDAWYVTVGNETFIRAPAPNLSSSMRSATTRTRPTTGGKQSTGKSQLYKRIAEESQRRNHPPAKKQTNAARASHRVSAKAAPLHSTADQLDKTKVTNKSGESLQSASQPPSEGLRTDGKNPTSETSPVTSEAATNMPTEENQILRGIVIPESSGITKDSGISCEAAEDTSCDGDRVPVRELSADGEDVEPLPVTPGLQFSERVLKDLIWTFTAPQFLFLSPKNMDPHGAFGTL